MMTVAEACLWGLLGAAAVEGLQFAGAIRRAGGWPWKRRGEPGPWPLLVSVLIRMGVGAGVAAAAGASGQLAGPLSALAFGVAAPLLVEQMARQLPAEASAAPADIVRATPGARSGPSPARKPAAPPRRSARTDEGTTTESQASGGDDG